MAPTTHFTTSQLVSQSFPPIDFEGSPWERFQERFEELLTVCIDTLLIFKGKITLESIDEMIESAPRNSVIFNRQMEICRDHIGKNADLLISPRSLTRDEGMAETQAFLSSLQSSIQKMQELGESLDERQGFECDRDAWESFFREEKQRELDQLTENAPSVCMLNSLIAVENAATQQQNIWATSHMAYWAMIFATEPPFQRNGALIIWRALTSENAPKIRFI